MRDGAAGLLRPGAGEECGCTARIPFTFRGVSTSS